MNDCNTSSHNSICSEKFLAFDSYNVVFPSFFQSEILAQQLFDRDITRLSKPTVDFHKCTVISIELPKLFFNCQAGNS